MFNVKEKLAEFFKGLIPTQTRTIYDSRQQPPTIATSLDVDRVHEIFQEAQVGSVRDLFALYRDILMADNHMQTEFGSRKLAVLGDAMRRAGFVNYVDEWWHFSWGDQMWAALTGEAQAHYGEARHM